MFQLAVSRFETQNPWRLLGGLAPRPKKRLAGRGRGGDEAGDADATDGDAAAFDVDVPRGVEAAAGEGARGIAEAIVGDVEDDGSLLPRRSREPAREVVGNVSLASDEDRGRKGRMNLRAHRPMRAHDDGRRRFEVERLGERASKER